MTSFPPHLPASVQPAWVELAEQLEPIEETDLPALEAMATALARARAADTRIAEDGDYLTHPNGHVYPHPALRISQRAWTDYRAWAQRFQLTPADRGEKRVRRSLEAELEAMFGPNPRKRG